MRMFKSYLIDKKCLTPQTLYLPTFADIVAVRDTHKGLMLLAIITPTATMTELRTFKVCADDENIYADAVKYIGSFDTDIGIRNVVEIVRGE